MTIGTRIDAAINAALEALANAANKFLDHYWPIDETEKVIMAATAEALAAAEADMDTWYPDELWAAIDRGHVPWETPTIRRPFCDTDDFAEPLGEYPDLPPQGETK